MFSKTMVAAALVLMAGTVSAGDQTPGLDRREARQEQRIDQGEASGQLTRRESARLEHAENRLARNEAKAKADGVVTVSERARLQHEAQVNSRRIFRQKHDAQTRPGAAH